MNQRSCSEKSNSFKRSAVGQVGRFELVGLVVEVVCGHIVESGLSRQSLLIKSFGLVAGSRRGSTDEQQYQDAGEPFHCNPYDSRDISGPRIAGATGRGS